MSAALHQPIEVELPTFHHGQVEAYRLPGRFKAIRCGRRWGKSLFAEVVACNAAIRGQAIGIFTPSYKFQAELYNDIARFLAPVIYSSSKVEGVIRTTTGGRIDFWTLEDDRAGRSRKYHKVIIDEAAFAKDNMMEIWERSIQPTLLDYQGTALVLSNTKGALPDNFFYRICKEPQHGFVQFHAKSIDNPTIPERKPGESHEDWQLRRDEEFAQLRRERPPLVYAQEYDAEFVNWFGQEFFELANFLTDYDPVREIGTPYELPKTCDGVFATIDTATKTGQKRDGTGVTFWSHDRFAAQPALRVLDWDLKQIEGSLLIAWLPSVFQRLEGFAKQCGARFGSMGAYIEDKSSGMILLQQAQRAGMPAEPVDSKLTSVGKTERALSVSGYVYRKMVGLCRPAFERNVEYHGNNRNHWISQVIGFRMGADDDPKAEDDLLDTMTYGIAIALGNSEGF